MTPKIKNDIIKQVIEYTTGQNIIESTLVVLFINFTLFLFIDVILVFRCSCSFIYAFRASYDAYLSASLSMST